MFQSSALYVRNFQQDKTAVSSVFEVIKNGDASFDTIVLETSWQLALNVLKRYLLQILEIKELRIYYF